jgi:hypothetical protein
MFGAAILGAFFGGWIHWIGTGRTPVFRWQPRVPISLVFVVIGTLMAVRGRGLLFRAAWVTVAAQHALFTIPTLAARAHALGLFNILMIMTIASASCESAAERLARRGREVDGGSVRINDPGETARSHRPHEAPIAGNKPTTLVADGRVAVFPFPNGSGHDEILSQRLPDLVDGSWLKVAGPKWRDLRVFENRRVGRVDWPGLSDLGIRAMLRETVERRKVLAVAFRMPKKVRQARRVTGLEASARCRSLRRCGRTILTDRIGDPKHEQADDDDDRRGSLLSCAIALTGTN